MLSSRVWLVLGERIAYAPPERSVDNLAWVRNPVRVSTPKSRAQGDWMGPLCGRALKSLQRRPDKSSFPIMTVQKGASGCVQPCKSKNGTHCENAR